MKRKHFRVARTVLGAGITAFCVAQVVVAPAMAAPAGTIGATYVLAESPTAIIDLAPAPDGSIALSGIGAGSEGSVIPVFVDGTTAGVFQDRYRNADQDVPGPVAVTSDGTSWYGMASGAVYRITQAGVATRFAVGIGALQDATVGPDGNVWFVEPGGSRIFRVLPNGTSTAFSLPSPSNPSEIVTGSDGRLWVNANGAAQIAAFDIGSSTFTTYTPPSPVSTLSGIALGPDGNIWFGDRFGERITSVTPAGVFQECTLPVGTLVHDLAADATSIWVTTAGTPGTILQVDPFSCAITPFTLAGFDETGKIIVASDGRLWFTIRNGGLGAMTTTGVATSYPVDVASSHPMIIVAAPDGMLWYTSVAGNSISRLNPRTGSIDVFEIRPPHRGVVRDWPVGLAVAPDGDIWFTELTTHAVGRLDPDTGTITEYPLSGPYQPLLIGMGPDGNLWVSTIAGMIVRVNPATGAMTDFPVFAPGMVPVQFAIGADGNMWFAEEFGDAVSVVNTSGVVVNRFALSPGAFAISAALGADGNVWVTEALLGRIARITPTGTVTEFSLSDPNSRPIVIAAGPDGNLWVTLQNGNAIVRVDPATGAMTEFSISESGSRPTGITYAPDGHMYITAQIANNVFRMSLGIPFAIAPVDGNAQSTEQGTAFANPLVARVTDADGDPVIGASVTFTAPSPTGPSAAFSSGTTATVITGADGRATAPALTANANVGAYEVTATVAGVANPARFQLTNRAIPPPTTTTTTTSIPPATPQTPTPIAPITPTAPAATLTPAPSNPQGALPRTGSETQIFLWLGIALCGFGFTLVTVGAPIRKRASAPAGRGA